MQSKENLSAPPTGSVDFNTIIYSSGMLPFMFTTEFPLRCLTIKGTSFKPPAIFADPTPPALPLCFPTHSGPVHSQFIFFNLSHSIY